MSTDPCGDNAAYDNYIIGDQAFCMVPNPPAPGPGDIPYEGCVCVNGSVLENPDGDCIPIPRCGCIWNGKYYPVSAKLGLYEPGNSISDKIVCTPSEDQVSYPYSEFPFL